MKYLIVSDIHGSMPALRRILDFYDREGCGMLLLLGDLLNYGPRNRLPEGLDPQGIVAGLNARAKDIVCVRGNCDSEVDQMLFDFPTTSTYAYVVDTFGERAVRLFLTHGHVYNPDHLPVGPVDVLLYGHTHLWHLTPSPDDTTPAVVNVGSPTFPKGGNPPTFATYEAGVFCIYHAETAQLLQTMRI